MDAGAVGVVRPFDGVFGIRRLGGLQRRQSVAGSRKTSAVCCRGAGVRRIGFLHQNVGLAQSVAVVVVVQYFHAVVGFDCRSRD